MAPDLDLELLGWPEDGPTLRLDYRQFAYAGKFVMSTTGKAVARDPDDPGAASGSGVNDAGESPGGTNLTGATDETDATDRSPEPAGSTDPDVLAAVSFSADRTDPDRLWLRYVTVRADRRGEGIAPRLVGFVVDRAAGRYDRVAIAVNNPFAYEALSRAGFLYTGDRTGLAEVVLERPAAAPARLNPERYRAGLDAVADRELSDAERVFVAEKRARGPPARDRDRYR